MKKSLTKFKHIAKSQQFLASPYFEPNEGKNVEYVTINDVM